MSPPRGAGAGGAGLPPSRQGAPQRAGSAERAGGGRSAALRMRPPRAGRGREAAAERDAAAAGAAPAAAAAGSGAAGCRRGAVSGPAATRPARPRQPPPRQVRPAAGGERGPLPGRPPLLPSDAPSSSSAPSWRRRVGEAPLWAGRDPRAGPGPEWRGTGAPKGDWARGQGQLCGVRAWVGRPLCGPQPALPASCDSLQARCS